MKLFVIFYCYLIFLSFISTLNEEERKEFLDIHNFLRRAVVPNAADMQELEYDENIERNVSAFLEKCHFDHQRLYGYGENGRLATDANITNSVVSWFQERIYFNISAGFKRCSTENTNIDYLPEAQCGHYKILVKSTLKRIGCDYKFCKFATGVDKNYTDSFLTFCFYDSGQKEQPYEIGERCRGCNRGYQFCYNELCVPNKKYDRKLLSCKVVCQNCGTYFGSCLCNCPEGTTGNSCTGNSQTPNCSLCQKIGQNCINGNEDSKNGICYCKCKENYQGKYCEISSNQFTSSYYYIINGLPWRHGLHLPVNLLEFKNSFFLLQQFIVNDVKRFCQQNKITGNCKEISSTNLYSNNVQLIQGFPLMLENGSLAFRIFFNYSTQIKEEKFVTPNIFANIMNNPSKDMEEFFVNVRRIYPITGLKDRLVMKIEILSICISFAFFLLN